VHESRKKGAVDALSVVPSASLTRRRPWPTCLTEIILAEKLVFCAQLPSSEMPFFLFSRL